MNFWDQKLRLSRHQRTATRAAWTALLIGGLAACGGGGSGSQLSAQTITFPELMNIDLNSSFVNLNATASSNLAVTYQVTTPTVCSFSATPSTRLNLLAAGTCTVTASQSGNSSYAPAPDVSRSFSIITANALAAGKAAYIKHNCSDCHGSYATGFTQKVTKAANNAAVLTSAINGVGQMAIYRPINGGGITTQDINDIAAYLGAPY